MKKRKLEDNSSIAAIEQLLVKKRGYSVRLPKCGSDVIHLVSGGLDSIITWAILMEEYRYKVHPICLATGQKRNSEERKAVKFFSSYFKKRYPSNFIEPFFLTYPTSAPEISHVLRGNLRKTIHPDVLEKYYDKKTNTVPLTRKYLFPAFFPYPAALAALLFELQRDRTIRTIFCSILPTDGLYNESQTLTALRGATLSLCTFTNDYRWQVISPAFEKEIGAYLEKSDLVTWATSHKIPLQKTYSCLKGNEMHCGDCLVCHTRKEAFATAMVTDETRYEAQTDTTYAKPRTETPLQDRIKKIVRRPINAIRSWKRFRRVYIKDYY